MKQLQHFFYLFMLVFLTACGDGDPLGSEEKEEVIDGQPTISVNVSINNPQVDADNPAIVTAKVTDGGADVSGVVVSFASELGIFDVESATALTNSDGVATIGITAGSAQGASTITASVATGESGNVGFETAGDGIDPNQSTGGGETSELILVQMSLSSMQVAAGAPATVTAKLSGLSGPIAGQVISFSTNLGYLLPASGTALTNTDGNASIQINAGIIKGAGTITATAPNGESAKISFASEGDGSVASDGKLVKLSISNTQVSAASPATVTVTVSDEDGVVAGEVVQFATTLGVINPVSGTALTNSSGEAHITLTAGAEEGAGLITAKISGGEFDSIGFSSLGDASAIAGDSVTITISSRLITGAENETLTATVVNDAGTPVDGELVNFSSTLGILSPTSGTALTNSSGIATIDIEAGYTAGAGVASVTIDNGASAKVVFETTGDGVAKSDTITLSIDNIALDKSTDANLIATVLDKDGAPVIGDIVTFTSTLGLLDPISGTALTNGDGIVTMKLTAGDTEGAGLVTATTSKGQKAVVGFATKGDQTSEITLDVILVTPGTTDEISLINATTPGQLIATVNGLDTGKQVIVTFTSDIGEIPISTAITDVVTNQAIIDIYAGNDLGAGTVTATLKDGETGEKLLVVGATNLSMGSGNPFENNVAELSLAQISAGGTTVVSVDIIDENGVPYTLPVDVVFSSNCVIAGSATLSTPVTTANGTANSTYLAQGCVGDDPISVSANAGGVNLAASITVNVLSADAGSIEFVSASPENISLKGVGGEESSTVVFRVLDTNGNPVSNTDVDFSLNTEVGGISLNPSSATSNNEGLVQTVVNSGSVATTVRLTASINGTSPLISSQSSLLVVSTGIPDQDSFSLFANILNPEGWDVFNSEVSVTALMSDAFNNPVPDGTAVSFTTEGGTIEPSCVTLNGQCTVIWNSSNPLPEGEELGGADIPEVNNSMGQKFGGRATITATAIGEESFPDTNGNGRLDAGAEMTAFLGNNISGRPYDLSEAFVDHNEDGVYNPQVGGGEAGGDLETFIDFDVDGIFDLADTLYNGSLCSIPAHAGCSAEKSLSVRGELVMVMSGSDAFLTVNATIDAHETIDNAADLVVNITGENTGAASVIIADLHNQPMPQGTIIEFTATAGSIVGPDSFVWPNDNHNGGRAFSVSIEGEDEPKSGSLIVEITTPSGATTVYTPVSIVITGSEIIVP